MRLTFITSFLLLLLTSAYANICNNRSWTPTSAQEYCSMSARDYRSLLCDKEGMLGINNDGGLFGLPTGVCWWHSRFHRQATYLTYFCPDCEKPDISKRKGRRTIKKWLRDIIKQRRVVRIDGFRNLKEFTLDPFVKKYLKKFLQRWMARETFFEANWIRGLEGKPNWYDRSPRRNFYYDEAYGDPYEFIDNPELNHISRLRRLRQYYHSQRKEDKRKKQDMDRQRQEIERIYSRIHQEEKIAYIVLQLPGVAAHAALVLDIERRDNDEYHLKIQDSNYQHRTIVINGRRVLVTKKYRDIYWKKGSWYHSRRGDTPVSFNIFDQNNKDRHLRRINKAHRKFCGRELW